MSTGANTDPRGDRAAVVDLYAEMRAFDALPEAVRRALADAPADWEAAEQRDYLREGWPLSIVLANIADNNRTILAEWHRERVTGTGACKGLGPLRPTVKHRTGDRYT